MKFVPTFHKVVEGIDVSTRFHGKLSNIEAGIHVSKLHDSRIVHLHVVLRRSHSNAFSQFRASCRCTSPFGVRSTDCKQPFTA